MSTIKVCNRCGKKSTFRTKFDYATISVERICTHYRGDLCSDCYKALINDFMKNNLEREDEEYENED